MNISWAIYTRPDRDIYVQDTFVQDTFWTWTRLSTGQNTGHHTLDIHILNKDKDRT